MSGRSKFIQFDKPISDMDWAKMAVAIDMEGYIGIQKFDDTRHHKGFVSTRYILEIRLINTDPRVALWAKERFGGSLFHYEHTQRNPKHRDSFLWHVSTQRALAVLRGCLPHFIIKREQAETALAFYETGTTSGQGIRLPEDVLNRREMLRVKLKEQHHQKFQVHEGFRKGA